mgnify:FL=1|tara:strand:+ start:989 stop:1546 length:558 start_codon:yes stop_codon:yes gene_type:complete
MEDGKRDSDGIVGDQQKPAALKIYDNALGAEFTDELIQIFEANEKAHEVHEGDNHSFVEYNYTKYHKDEEIHGRLMEHLGQLYKFYLEALGTTNMINVSGFEEIKIKKLGHHDLHINAVDHESAIRAVHFLFFLDDSEGNIDYPLQRMGVEARKGRVIISPVSWEYPSNIHKSSKYICETFIHLA